jgi:hypothetical protein
MKHIEPQEILDSLQLLTETAERFVHQVPPSKRLEQVQRAMLAAITKAQLALSLYRPPHRSAGLPQPTPEKSPSKPSGAPPKPSGASSKPSGARKSPAALRLV